MTGDIDSTLPVGMTHLIDRSSDIIHQHGGVATQVAFDSLQEMSIEDFVKNVVPTLGHSDDRFAIIKDTTSDQMVRILRDNVAVYHITGIRDVFFDKMLERLMEDQQVTITPNLQFPLIQWKVMQSGEKLLVVEIQENQFSMRHSSFTDNHVIWHPRLWLKMRLTVQNIPSAWRLRAVQQHPRDLANDRLLHVPLPNVFQSGDICWGSTHYNRADTDKALSENDAILLTLDRFFNSTFNFDLIDDEDMMQMSRLYDEMPKLPEYDKEINDTGSGQAHMLRMFRCFSEHDSINRFRYRTAETAQRFLEEDI